MPYQISSKTYIKIKRIKLPQQQLLFYVSLQWDYYVFFIEILAIFGPLNSDLEFKLALAEF